MYFYSKLIAAGDLKVSYEVRQARELPGATGGKARLMDYYDYLRRANALCSSIGAKRTAVIFCVDKDIDDILRSRRRSPHVIYTDGYEVENYLYCNGNVEDALAAVLAIAPAGVVAQLPTDWRITAPVLWRDWIVTCIVTRMTAANVDANFGVASRINTPCTAPTDAGALQQRLLEIQQVSSLDQSAFDRLWHRVARKVDARMAAGLHDTVFRGKWYSIFLRHWLSSHTRSWRDHDLEAVIAATLDYHADWARSIRQKVIDIVQLCDLIKAA